MDMTRPARIALFGSFYRGFHVLSELLKGPVGRQMMVVGVATDDAGASFVSPARRVWAYPHHASEEAMVERIDAQLRSFPRFGFYNLHPCIDDGWPSGYAGPNPFQALLDDLHKCTSPLAAKFLVQQLGKLLAVTSLKA